MAWIHRPLAALLITAACSHAADTTLHVRLLDSLSSHSSADGTDFTAVVTSNWPSTGPVWIPSGSQLHGKVLRARTVGLGLRREQASLELGFSDYVLPDGTRHPLWARLRDVDNARENVKGGRIQGVDSASGPGGWVQGLWVRPRLTMIPRNMMGLVGLSGAIGEKLPLGPVSDVGLLLLRCLVFRLPQAEIRLPSGTDLRVEVTSLPVDPAQFTPEPASDVPQEEQEWFAQHPALVSEPHHRPVKDLINVALIGTEEQVIASLTGAGWSKADSISRDSFGRAYSAFTSMSGYQTAPVSPIYYEESLPDLVFEKSFNSVAKRHHVRLWRVSDLDGREIWLGAASHDVKMAIKRWPITFTHQIDPRIDRERERLTEDLRFAACIQPPAYVDRPPLAAEPSKVAATTDGRLVVLSVHSCQRPTLALAEMPSDVQRSTIGKGFRRLLLEARYHIFRGNIYYQGFQLLRRQKPEED